MNLVATMLLPEESIHEWTVKVLIEAP